MVAVVRPESKKRIQRLLDDIKKLEEQCTHPAQRESVKLILDDKYQELQKLQKGHRIASI